MATTYKTFLNNDVTTTRTLLHEAIPITGSIVSGTYAGANIKTYTADLFEAVYDYPYLSSSANHIFDITCGYSATSPLSASAVSDSVSAQDIQNKINMYNEMAKVLVGHDVTGSIQEFDQDGDLSAGGTKLQEIYALNFARLLTKDEIKKGSFVFNLGSGSTWDTANDERVLVSDYQGVNDYRVNSPAGEYGILYTSSATPDATNVGVGLVYYQAGVAILTASLFGMNGMDTSNQSCEAVLSSSTITANADALRRRFYDLDFNNTTELNSTIYFCRVNHNEFNYSANPTYLSSSQIVVKQQTTDAPVSFITSVGLYSADNELLGVAKISEPLKKDPNNELILRVRLDY